jgi:protein-S-isoprenylcysteine O-methyltransferase Ste14
MAAALRFYFLISYAVALVVVAVRTISMLATPRRAEHTPSGARRYLPAIVIPLLLVVPPLAVLFRVGELDAEWPAVRVAGLALGVYAACMQLWALATLGRFLVPRAVVFADHALITTGPYRFVRHPVYSGSIALVLGTALATLNVAVLLVCPLVIVGMLMEARVEEGLLETRFGSEYRAYARRTGCLVPRLGGG